MKIGLGILGVALVATLSDYTWYTLHVRHSVLAGVIHGAVLLTAVGGVLGLDARRVLKGLPIGALAGVGGALAYYLIAAVVDRRPYGVAIPAAWVTLWLLLAVLDGRWLRAPARRAWPAIAIRGALSADPHAFSPADRQLREGLFSRDHARRSMDQQKLFSRGNTQSR